MEITKANLDDLNAVKRCVEAAYRDYETTIGVSPGPLHDDYEELIRSGHVWTCKDAQGRVAGILVLFVLDDCLLLDNVAVFPQWQGSGIAGHFQDVAIREARARGLGKMRLYTHQKMTALIQMYQDHGWIETERRREAGYDRVYMEKEIREE
jgi:GNAT superfamily N-acetyltransferase